MIPVLPDVEILLDDGSGTYSLDLTDRVRLSSLDVSGHGRSDEFDQAFAGTLTVTLDNDDGALTSGAGFDEMPFGFGGFGGGGGFFYPGQGIRYNVTVGATTASRFTGRLTSATLGWEAETGLPSSVTLTAVDPLASLGRRVLRSVLEEEIRRDSPAAWYTLGEAEGSTSAGDTSGHGLPALVATGSGAAVVFGNGPADGLFAAAFAGGSGQYLLAPTPPITAASWSLLAFFSTTHTPTVGNTDPIVGLVFGPSVGSAPSTDKKSWGVTNNGKINGNGPVVNDGLLHEMVVTYDGATQLIYVDGTLASTLVTSYSAGTCWAGVGASVWDASAADTFSGSIAQVVFFDGVVLGASRPAAYWGALTGFAGDTTADRFARLATYGGLITSTTSGMSGQTMGPQDTAGKSFLDALQEVAAAEGGVLFADGEGNIVLQGRGYRAGKTTADLTLSADDIDVGTTAPLDDQQLVNQVTVSRTNGATQVYPPADDLVGVELYPQSLDLVVDNDADALRAAQWLIAKHTTAEPRLPSVSIDLMRCPQAEQIMAAEIGDRWEITDMPTQIWETFGDQTLEGWSETLTISGNTASWTLSANLLPWSLQTALVLDDPVYGALDSFPLMP
jgi:hypothetical protein